jgi:6-phosphogluconolactonase
MAEASPVIRRRIDRRIVLQAAAAMAAAGPELLRGGHAEAQPRASVATLFAYVGAFTTPERKGHGGGINVYRVDSASGAWSHVQLVEIVNPSFLALDRAQRFLYAVHADLDEVSAYTIDKQTGRITALNRQSCGGKNPVHLSIDPTGRWIITANYGAGSVGVVPIEKDGTLGPRADLVTLQGEPGPDRVRQAGSHPHEAVFDPSGRFIAVPDLGLDRIFVFRLDAATGKLSPNDPPSVVTRKRAGPRHIAFHPKMPLAYVVNELDSTVVTYRFDPQRGSLQAIQALPGHVFELHWRTQQRRDRRRAQWPLRLRVEPVQQYDRQLCCRSRRRNAEADRLGSDTCELAPLLLPRSGGQVALRGQRRRGIRATRREKHRHDRAIQCGSKRDAKPTGQIIKTNSPCTIVFA